LSVIGYFDSGFGGLSVVREIRRQLPDFSFIYLGDNARSPYGGFHVIPFIGTHSKECWNCFIEGNSCCPRMQHIIQRSAAAHSTGVSADSFSATKCVGYRHPNCGRSLAPQRNQSYRSTGYEVTVDSQAYPQEICKIDPSVQVRQQACPLLVPLIESGEFEKATEAAQRYIDQLLSQDKDIDTILLGCTHYALIADSIRSIVPAEIRTVSQGAIVADKLADYLRRHPEFGTTLDRSGDAVFLTTAYSGRIRNLATQFFGSPIEMSTIALQDK
jgi:glutamate racemase